MARVVTMVLARTVWVFVLVGVIMLVAMAMSVVVVVSMFVTTGINAYRCFSGQTASAFFTH